MADTLDSLWACVHCGEEITVQDHIECYSNGPISHRECFLRVVFGSVAHQEKRCSCFVPGSGCGDPPGMTKRQAAQAAVDFYYAAKEN